MTVVAVPDQGHAIRNRRKNENDRDHGTGIDGTDRESGDTETSTIDGAAAAADAAEAGLFILELFFPKI